MECGTHAGGINNHMAANPTPNGDEFLILLIHTVKETAEALLLKYPELTVAQVAEITKQALESLRPDTDPDDAA